MSLVAGYLFMYVWGLMRIRVRMKMIHFSLTNIESNESKFKYPQIILTLDIVLIVWKFSISYSIGYTLCCTNWLNELKIKVTHFNYIFAHRNKELC